MVLPFPIILASGSPRRKDLLRDLIPEFEIVVADVDETLLPNEDPVTATTRLAITKARIVAALRPNALVIAGDTLVAYQDEENWQILGKPADRNEAADMLRRLSGRTHQVTTGVCLAGPKGERAFAEGTEVTFRELSRDEIDAYVATGDSLDKAGAYAIQGMAAAFIRAIDGSRTNVVGLPLERLAEELAEYAKRSGDATVAGPGL